MNIYNARMGQFIKTYKPKIFGYNPLIYNVIGKSDTSLMVIGKKELPDISFWQEGIDWDQMQSQTNAVIIRAGQGNAIDSRFVDNYKEAKKADMKRGIYWFYDDRVSPGRQAGLLVELLKYDFPEMDIWVDWETTYKGAYGGIKNVIAMMEAVEIGLKMRTGLYTGYYWFRDNTNPITHNNQYNYLKSRPLWLPWYTADVSRVKIPAPWDRPLLWQWGTPSLGEEYGASSMEIDMNLFVDGEEEFNRRYNVNNEPGPPIIRGLTMEIKAEGYKPKTIELEME